MQDGELGVWSKRQVCSIIPSQQILNYKQLGVKAIFGTNNISDLSIFELEKIDLDSPSDFEEVLYNTYMFQSL